VQPGSLLYAGQLIELVTQGLSHDQPPLALVHSPDCKKSGSGTILVEGFESRLGTGGTVVVVVVGGGAVVVVVVGGAGVVDVVVGGVFVVGAGGVFDVAGGVIDDALGRGVTVPIDEAAVWVFKEGEFFEANCEMTWRECIVALNAFKTVALVDALKSECTSLMANEFVAMTW
jgi:hypothetical protein